MIRSAIARSVRLEVEPAQLVVEIVLQRLGPGDHVGHGVVLALARLFHLGPRRPASAPRSGRATPRPSSSAARSRPRCRASRRSPARALRRWGRRATRLAPASSAGRSGSSSWRSSIGFSCISCSIRSSRARIGNCRISIDWIIRGARICFCTSPQVLTERKSHGMSDAVRVGQNVSAGR